MMILCLYSEMHFTGCVVLFPKREGVYSCNFLFLVHAWAGLATRSSKIPFGPRTRPPGWTLPGGDRYVFWTVRVIRDFCLCVTSLAAVVTAERHHFASSIVLSALPRLDNMHSSSHHDGRKEECKMMPLHHENKRIRYPNKYESP